MKLHKHILGLTSAAALLCSPLIFADISDATTQTAQPVTSVATSSVQLKTSDGRTFQVTMDPNDIQNMKVGDMLQVVDLGATPATTEGTSSTNPSVQENTPSNQTPTTNSSTPNNPQLLQQ